MRFLLRAALANAKHFILLIVTAVALCTLVVANGVEVFALGLVTRGSDFFTLFAPERGGKIEQVEEITKADIDARWAEIDVEGIGVITKPDAATYMGERGNRNILDVVGSYFGENINLSKDMKTLAIMLLCVAFFKAIATFSSRYCSQLVATRVARDLRQKYFEHIQQMPMSFYHDYDMGSLSTRVVGDAEIVAKGINATLINYLQTPFTAIVNLAACFYISPHLSMIIFLGTFFLVGVLVYGLHVANMGISGLIVFLGLLYYFYEPIKKFAEANADIQRAAVAAERMYEVLDQTSAIQDKEGAIVLEGFEHAIEFENVWFKYDEEWVLKDLSFTVKKGETVALVGPTGAGKSTIVNLLPRLYDVQKGCIRIDGKTLQDYSQKSIRENIAFVPQRPFLFLDTIASNISFGRNFTKPQIEGAARRAHAEEFIVRLPQRFDTMVAEGGKNLSGGQQQRLAIARALVKDAPILVMDEATSSLDNVSENNIKEAIKELRGKVTQILIAHRLSTVEHADRIIYLEHGKKIGEGTKDELLASCPGFKHMWDMGAAS